MKKVCIILVFCLFAGMFLSSCGSSKPCPAYRSVTGIEQPLSGNPQG
jgi:hypothetical protein